MAIYISIALITLGTFLPPLGTAVLQQQLALAPLITFLQFIALGPSFLIFYLFPDGRFVPRWTVYGGAFWLAYSVSWLIFPEFKPPITFFAIQSAFNGVMLFILGLTLTAIYSQFYRYHRVSTPLQRQQTKWVLFGFSIVLFTVVLAGLTSRLVTFTPPSPTSMLFLLVAIPFVMLGLMVPPVAVMFSILKFRLWDIDILVRRTVTYAVLAALLAIVYFACIILFQQVFASVTGQRSEIATVLSTLSIAALFIPLRDRIQDAIDRHFNRKKYNAQRVIENFSRTVRDETDLDNLTGELVKVVQETVQPKSVSLWLKKDSGK
jgi:hypothetical protein